MSQAFHVPSVPRGLLLPGLDTYEMPTEHDDADPMPPGSNWLFRPPPYVSRADPKAEMVTIRNPSAWKRANLSGFTLSDRQRRHVYTFPEGCAVGARKFITLHCCPGRLSRAEVDALPKNDLLWKNQDGSLRRKECLNDDGDTVKLSDARGREIASLYIPADGDDEDEPQSLELPGVKRAQVLALRKLVLTLCYLRLACIGVAASRVMVHPDVFMLFTALAHALDVLCRWASSQPGVPMDDVGVVLATMGDRLSALVLLGSLVVLDSDSRHVQLFAGMLALDIAANWLQLSAASAASGPRPLAGGVCVKGKGAGTDFATHLMLRHPTALTLVSLGNEAFLLWSYLVASASLSYRLKPLFLNAECAVERWIADLLSWCFSSGNFWEVSRCRKGPSAERTNDDDQMMDMEAHKSDGAVGGEGIVTAWKVVWMCLMVCCAVRQLLSCIQALISMSTLSSGVIADAAGHDMQRTMSNYGSCHIWRGRSSTRANGGGVSSGGGRAGARSRSRVRHVE